MTVFVGTFPEVHRHIEFVDKGFCAGKGQHGIVCEVCPGAEHLHLIIVFNAVAFAFVCTSRYITYCLANQIILHNLLVIDCANIQLFNESAMPLDEKLFSQGLWTEISSLFATTQILLNWFCRKFGSASQQVGEEMGGLFGMGRFSS